MDRPVVAVVLAGGSGTRLYPASRSDRPKQLCSLGPDDRSLLARTLARTGFADHRVVLTGPDHADQVRDHLDDLAGRDTGHADADEADADGRDPEVWVEPAARDTGPALVYAAVRARAEYADSTHAAPERADPVLVCLPSDHHVAGDFGAVAERAAAVAVETDGLVCLGVEPDRPATGYGYVRPGPTTDGYAPVRSFTEKPDAERAREFVAAGALWNAGVFAWTPAALLSAARDTPLAPLVTASEDDADLAAAYQRLDPVSVDRAVMERADDAYVVPAEIEWDDLGTWDALARVLPADADGTVTTGETLTVDAADSVLTSDGDTHVTAVGVSDLVVAAFGDRVLVVPRGETERVREAVERLRETGEF